MKLAINVDPITFVVQGKGLKKAKKKKKVFNGDYTLKEDG